MTAGDQSEITFSIIHWTLPRQPMLSALFTQLSFNHTIDFLCFGQMAVAYERSIACGSLGAG